MSPSIALKLLGDKIQLDEDDGTVTLKLRCAGRDAVRDAARLEINERLAEKAREYLARETPSEGFAQALENLERAEGELEELERQRKRAELERESLIYKASSGGEQLAKKIAKIDETITDLEARLSQAAPGIQALKDAVWPYQAGWSGRFERAVLAAAAELEAQLQAGWSYSVLNAPLEQFFTEWFRHRTQLGILQYLRSRSHAAGELAKQLFGSEMDSEEFVQPGQPVARVA